MKCANPKRRPFYRTFRAAAKCLIYLDFLLAGCLVQHQSARKFFQAIEQWRQDAPKLAAWAEENLPQGFAVFDYPPSHRVRLRTTNGLERINRELKRRTRVASIFPNPASCLRLASALLNELDEEWMNGKIYLNFNS